MQQSLPMTVGRFWLAQCAVLDSASDCKQAHDVDWPLFLLGGTLCYGVVAFGIYRWRSRHVD